MIRKLVDKIENTQAALPAWLSVFLGLLFIRFFLESLSSIRPNGFVTSDSQTIIHFYLFYLGTALSLVLVLKLFSGKRIEQVSKVVLAGLIITWLPPIIDLLVSKGKGITMTYLFYSGADLWRAFLSFFGPLGSWGITIGIRIEVVLILLAGFIYLYLAKKSLIRSIAGVVVLYFALFIWLAFPSVLKLVAGFFEPIGNQDVITYLNAVIQNSLLADNYFHPMSEFRSDRLTELLFITGVSQVFYLVISCLIACWLYFKNRQHLLSLLKNSRFLRIIHFALMMTIGFVLADPNLGVEYNWVSFVSFAVLFLSFYFAWMFAVDVNDLYDVAIDQVSNTDRPLVTGDISGQDLKDYNFLFLTGSLVGGYLAGHHTFFLLLSFTAAYYIYSAPPLRLKRVPVVSPFLVAVASLCAVMAGFYFLNANKSMTAFPVNTVALVLIGITLAANAKDIKDIEGDRQAGITTLANFFQGRFAKRLVVILMGAAFFLLPVVALQKTNLLYSAIPLGLLAFIAIEKKFPEKYLFFIYYLYLFSILLVLKGFQG